MKFEIVIDGVAQQGTFDSDDEACANAANLRRSQQQVIKVRPVDGPEVVMTGKASAASLEGTLGKLTESKSEKDKK